MGSYPINLKRIRCWAGVAWLITVLMHSQPALAWENITVLASSNTQASQELITQLQQDLQKTSKTPVNISPLPTADTLPVVPGDTLVIAVGVRAFLQASTLDSRIPVIGVLIPKISYEKIISTSNRPSRSFSAIYIDQPASRQIALIKALLPSATNIGVLLGPSSNPLEQDILRAARIQGLSVSSKQVDDSTDLIPQLKKTLETSNLLLAIADPLVYNKETAQTILLTSYRHQKPVIGFSQAYVKAGALAAIFTTPAQFSRQTAELVSKLRNRNELPPASYPQYLSVEINRQVARSLSIETIEETALAEKLMRIERSPE